METEIFEFAMWLTGHDFDTIKQMYNNWSKKPEPTKYLEPSVILEAVCEVNKLSIFDVKSENRLKELVTARREYCYLACELIQKTKKYPRGYTLNEIGLEINKDHALVLYHEKVIEGWM